jgi:hypothetical protein
MHQIFNKDFNQIWTEEKIPLDWKKGLIVKIPKKGDVTVCDTYRGITLLSVPSKVFGKVLVERIKDGVENSLRRTSRIQARTKHTRTTFHIQVY